MTEAVDRSAEDQVLAKFRMRQFPAHHFAEISRIQAALDLQRVGILRCSWVPIDGQSSKDMLRCELAPGVAI